MSCTFLREMLDNGVVSALVWLDTRDMLSDGLTKGAVSRDALMLTMDGQITFAHDAKVWLPRPFPAGLALQSTEQ